MSGQPRSLLFSVAEGDPGLRIVAQNAVSFSSALTHGFTFWGSLTILM
jgi:hypothetical protein